MRQLPQITLNDSRYKHYILKQWKMGYVHLLGDGQLREPYFSLISFKETISQSRDGIKERDLQ